MRIDRAELIGRRMLLTMASTALTLSAPPAFGQPNDPNDNPFADPAELDPATASRQPTSNTNPGGRTPTAPIAPIARNPALGIPQTQQPPAVAQAPPSLAGVWTRIADKPDHPPLPPGAKASDDPLFVSRYIPPLMINISRVNVLTSDALLLVENVNANIDLQTRAENVAERAPQWNSLGFQFQRTYGSFNPNHYTWVNTLDGKPDPTSTLTIERGANELEDVLTFKMSDPRFAIFNNQEFQRARLPDNVTLSKDRFDPDLLDSRLGRTDKFAGMIELFNPSLTGWDLVDMSPIDPGRGQKINIFATPGAKEFSTDDYVAKGVPYGLRGIQKPYSSAKLTKITVSSEVETQKQMSANMGISVAGFGANFSYDKAQSVKNSHSRSMDISVTRLSRYVAILDLPNQKLDFNFRRSLQRVIDGQATAQSLIDTYGTHYANAITYGALGYTELATEVEEDLTSLSTKWNAAGEGTYKQVSGSIGGGSGSGTTSGSGSSRTITAFTAVGGSGTGNEQSFTANDTDLVPILFDLRPISELANSLFFPLNGPVSGYSAHIAKLGQAKMAIDAAITEHHANARQLTMVKASVPRAYKLKFISVRCTYATDNGQPLSKIELSGKLTAGFTDALTSNRDLVLINSPIDGNDVPTVSLPCGANTAPHMINKSQVLVTSAEEPRKAVFSFHSDLHDYRDPQLTDAEKVGTHDVFQETGKAIIGAFDKSTAEAGQESLKKELLRKSVALNFANEFGIVVEGMAFEIPMAPNVLQAIALLRGYKANSSDRTGVLLEYSVQRLQ